MDGEQPFFSFSLYLTSLLSKSKAAEAPLNRPEYVVAPTLLMGGVDIEVLWSI